MLTDLQLARVGNVGDELKDSCYLNSSAICDQTVLHVTTFMGELYVYIGIFLGWKLQGGRWKREYKVALLEDFKNVDLKSGGGLEKVRICRTENVEWHPCAPVIARTSALKMLIYPHNRMCLTLYGL